LSGYHPIIYNEKEYYMENRICMHFFVSGHVQGVWFRASTQDEAKALGLTGWVRNLLDGRVEVLACGGQKELEMLHEWLKKGPELAKVEQVIAEEAAFEEHDRFALL
jgi:acylphosphatase